jgi:hypothetical protein
MSLLGFVIVLGVAAGAFVAGQHIGGSRPPSRVAASQGPGAGDTGPTEIGAIDAGARFATLVSELIDSPAVEATRLIYLLATPNYAQTLQLQADTSLAEIRKRVDELPGRAVFRQSVLATHLDAMTGNEAQVSVWMTTTLAQVGVDVPPLTTYSIQTVKLVWDGAWWRLDGSSSESGPTPMLSGDPSSSSEFDARLDGFSDWRNPA